MLVIAVVIVFGEFMYSVIISYIHEKIWSIFPFAIHPCDEILKLSY